MKLFRYLNIGKTTCRITIFFINLNKFVSFLYLCIHSVSRSCSFLLLLIRHENSNEIEMELKNIWKGKTQNVKVSKSLFNKEKIFLLKFRMWGRFWVKNRTLDFRIICFTYIFNINLIVYYKPIKSDLFFLFFNQF